MHQASVKLPVAVGAMASAHGAAGQGQPALGLVRGCPGNHADAVDNGADADTQGAARAAVSDRGQVRFGIKLDSLRTGMNVIDVTHGKGQKLLLLVASVFPVLQHLEASWCDSALQL